MSLYLTIKELNLKNLKFNLKKGSKSVYNRKRTQKLNLQLKMSRNSPKYQNNLLQTLRIVCEMQQDTGSKCCQNNLSTRPLQLFIKSPYN